MNAPGITLRPWVPADAPRMAELLSSPAVYRYLAAALPVPYTEAHATEFINHCSEADNIIERAIIMDGEPVGTIGAGITGHTALIGYWLGEAYQRRGIMSQALPLFIDRLPLHIAQLQAKVFDFNPASQALLRRCSFTQQPGSGPERAQDGQMHPLLLFERTR